MPRPRIDMVKPGSLWMLAPWTSQPWKVTGRMDLSCVALQARTDLASSLCVCLCSCFAFVDYPVWRAVPQFSPTRTGDVVPKSLDGSLISELSVSSHRAINNDRERGIQRTVDFSGNGLIWHLGVCGRGQRRRAALLWVATRLAWLGVQIYVGASQRLRVRVMNLGFANGRCGWKGGGWSISLHYIGRLV